jgi:hypothetical protein
MLNLPKFLFTAAKYELGDAVGEQLEDAVYHGAGWEDQNPAALRLCLDWLNRNADDFNDHLSEDASDELANMVASLEDYLG